MSILVERGDRSREMEGGHAAYGISAFSQTSIHANLNLILQWN